MPSSAPAFFCGRESVVVLLCEADRLRAVDGCALSPLGCAVGFCSLRGAGCTAPGVLAKAEANEKSGVVNCELNGLTRSEGREGVCVVFGRTRDACEEPRNRPRAPLRACTDPVSPVAPARGGLKPPLTGNGGLNFFGIKRQMRPHRFDEVI